MTKKSALVVGVGAARGLGAAIARRFAREGFHITVLGRNAEKLKDASREMIEKGFSVESIVGDVTDEATIARAVAAAEGAGKFEAALFNAGNNWPTPLLDLTPQKFEEFWRVNAYSGFLFAQAVLKVMAPRGHGTIVFTGASGSLRGKANFVGFAAAKAALRAVAQSAAREYGPKGIHIAHVVVDGAIDGERINTFLPKLKEQRGADGLLDPDAIAENYWTLHTQQRSAWTHEIDVRPWVESW